MKKLIAILSLIAIIGCTTPASAHEVHRGNYHYNYNPPRHNVYHVNHNYRPHRPPVVVHHYYDRYNYRRPYYYSHHYHTSRAGALVTGIAAGAIITGIFAAIAD